MTRRTIVVFVLVILLNIICFAGSDDSKTLFDFEGAFDLTAVQSSDAVIEVIEAARQIGNSMYEYRMR